MSAEVQASSSRRKAPAEVAQATRVNFAARLNALPAVTTLRGVATHAYDSAKQSYAFVAVPLQLAEIGVQYAVEKSLPVVDKFSPQLRYVDRLACRGLDNLEAVYPDVTHKQPREILNDTVAFGRSKLASVKEYGVSKAQDVKTIAVGALHVVTHPVQTLSACTRQTFSYTLKALEVLDAALDKHMAASAIAMPERAPSDAPDFTTLLTLLDTVVFKAGACAKAEVTAWGAVVRQRNDQIRYFLRVRHFITAPPPDSSAEIVEPVPRSETPNTEPKVPFEETVHSTSGGGSPTS
ncbi:perilipin-2-like [Ixodes scapularis]|uniref:perilipin-2-like n=1 Tax=Ixodes scapularis TaxID=6945 RepID=UPI001A9D23CA|nr:perilipin-2-like [Ixodes scapularis]